MDKPLSSLKLWLDPVPRSGPENMAVDDWLIETSDSPILRVYEWAGRWGSLGRFCCLDQALEISSSVRWVRRSTGGGVVDHQNDWTYSLVIPGTVLFSQIRATESYRIIHECLSIALSERFKLSTGSGTSPEVGGVCFQKAVEFDVIDHSGNKIAGAGQRRTKSGLLHQGSVAGKCEQVDSINRSKRLAEVLGETWEEVFLLPPAEVIDVKVAERYGKASWTERR